MFMYLLSWLGKDVCMDAWQLFIELFTIFNDLCVLRSTAEDIHSMLQVRCL